ncbi:MAG TPA: hypothetical protein VI199_09990, partial [Novosphingobium sp.]
MDISVRLACCLGLFVLGGPAQAVEPAAAPAARPEVALGQCMTLKSTGEDRIALARWFITALGSAPQVKEVVTIAPGAKDQQDRAVAAVFTRLLTVACLTEAQAVTRTSGQAGFRVAGEALGRIAMLELLSDPAANATMGGFGKYVNEADFAKLKPAAP